MRTVTKILKKKNSKGKITYKKDYCSHIFYTDIKYTYVIKFEITPKVLILRKLRNERKKEKVSPERW